MIEIGLVDITLSHAFLSCRKFINEKLRRQFSYSNSVWLGNQNLIDDARLCGKVCITLQNVPILCYTAGKLRGVCVNKSLIQLRICTLQAFVRKYAPALYFSSVPICTYFRSLL